MSTKSFCHLLLFYFPPEMSTPCESLSFLPGPLETVSGSGGKKWLLGPSRASPSSVTPPFAIPLQRWQTEPAAGSRENMGAASRARDTQTWTNSCISRMHSIFVFPIIVPTPLGFVKIEEICGKIFSQQEEKPAKVILSLLSPTLWEAGKPGD